jgi:hypothetical protein
MCFIEFSDEDKYQIEFEFTEDDEEYKYDISVSLYTGFVHPSECEEYGKIDYYLKMSSELKEFYLDIDVAIKRILDEYIDIDYQISRDFVEHHKSDKGKEYIGIDFYKKENKV